MLNKNMSPDTDKKPEKPLMIKMAGYLEKKGRMRVVGVRRWKKRWCVLEGKLLLYFRTQLEYSHHLSPCRGSVNMGLVLSITPRGPCQLQIVTRSQIIVFRTKTKTEQEGWFNALRDARNNNYYSIKSMDQKSFIMEMHRRLADECRINFNIVNDNHLRYGRSLKVSLDDIFFELGKKNGLHIVTSNRLSALRKCESDNRISFYRERHGLVRTKNIHAAYPISDKESCRSRSLSYESIYFKPQEKCTSNEPSKSQSCRELVGKAAKRMPNKYHSVSKKTSRSFSFKSYGDSDSDDYDYIEESRTKQKYSQQMTQIKEPRQYPTLPLRGNPKKEEEISSLSTVAPSEEFFNQEANIDVIYVNNDRKVRVSDSESESDLVLERGSEKTIDVEEKPPPLPVKKKSKQNNVFEGEKHYQKANGVYVFNNGTEEVIYDVPIPHGKLIEHFRRLTITPVPPVKHYSNNAVYHDSLEPSLFETIHMTPDSLEIASMFPVYKRWSNDSGFNYEEPNSFSPDQTHFEDSLEPVIAMMHHDRKIWQNVPNINSIDYFR